MQTEQEKLKEEFEKEFEGIFDDEDIYRNVVDFWLFKMTAQKQKMVKMISTIDTKAHACLFNDGEQSKNPYCYCYLEALSDIKQRINEL